MYPLLHSDRLLLSTGLRCLKKSATVPGLNSHIKLLEEHLDFQALLYDEFRNKNLFLQNGLAGFYFIIKYIHEKMNMDFDLLNQRIISSDLWDMLSDMDQLRKYLGLVTGLSGIILVYQDILNNKLQ